MAVRAYTVEVATTGAAGVAESAAGAGVSVPGGGKLLSVQLDYDPTAPITTDVTVTNMGRTILNRANTATDVVISPREQVDDTLGVDIAAQFDKFVILGKLEVAVAQSNALNPAVRIVFFIEV